MDRVDLVHEVTIAAPVERVWALLTTPDGLREWMAISAEVDLRPDGALSWTHENGATMRGRIVEIDPLRRLVLRYGWEDDLLGVPPESTTVEFTLAAMAGGTAVTMRHLDLPPATAPDHDLGWSWFLRRLAHLADHGR